MRLASSVVAVAVVMSAAVSAHHSSAAFDLNAQITIQGTISRLDWTNPHVYIYVDATTVDGQTGEWAIETDAIPILTRSGWRREAVVVGSEVTVRANPDRNTQRNHARLLSMALGDGVALTPRSGGRASSVARATSLEGVWNGLRAFTGRRMAAVVPTEKGKTAMAAYTDSTNPVAQCVPFPAPFLTSLPYLNTIEIRDDTVLIRSEFFNVDRTVYMDGRGHPDNGARTNQGHAIGRWEGGVLVVDTTLFADHRVGNSAASSSQGLPSGSRKHVVERYQLSDDGTRLFIDFVLEDPEYLAEPLSGHIEWDYTSNLQLLRFGCDTEQARRFTLR